MKYYFIGIKGSGMSSLAEILFDLGNTIVGYDDDPKPKYTEEPLLKRGIKIYYDQTFNLTDETIIYSPAFRLDHKEILRAKALGLKCLLYNEMLGELTKQFETIAVCGCHGKTTTTALLSHVISNADGAELANYLIGDGTGHAAKDNKYFIIEACEHRRHFLHYYPQYIIMTNIEFDHVDYYHDLEDVKSAYEEFSSHAAKLIIACGDDLNIRSIKIDKEVMYYGFNDNNDVIAKNIELATTGSLFDVYIKEKFIGHFNLPLYGRHMILNALSVITMTYLLNIDMKEVEAKILDFPGAKRRFKEKVFGDIVTIDDYAHHPTELRVTIESARQKYPNKKIIAIYLPNTYSRTQTLYKEEAEFLNKADKVYVMDIKSDRERQEDFPGVSSDLIINLLNNGEKISIDTVDKLLQYKDSVLIFMSCTSIYQLQEKYEELLKERK
ncbi:MAG: UDP-N-acetylmuramate--L-alanine ligase [Bacilli bacterium]|nr:UDP-N-acetylmuramate--L-alanine ligase [Bacilli bacterium]